MKNKIKNGIAGKSDGQRRADFSRREILTVLFVCAFWTAIFGGCAEKEDYVVISSDGYRKESEAEAIAYGIPDKSGTESDKLICVHVCGEVKSPGLVFLPVGSRAGDALDAAGGFTLQASQTAVNLAALLADGQQLYFPSGEEEIARVQEDSGKVNLNTADEKRLCMLPGIGESKAAAIVRYREENGSFDAPEDLMKVPGIKEALYQQVCDLIDVK